MEINNKFIQKWFEPTSLKEVKEQISLGGYGGDQKRHIKRLIDLAYNLGIKDAGGIE